MKNRKSITQQHIVKRLMDECGLSHSMATRTYNCFIGLVEESVTSLVKMNFGHVGALTPKVVKSKSVAMNFKRSKVGVEKTQRYYHLDERARFTLKLYRSFLDKVEFNPAHSHS